VFRKQKPESFILVGNDKKTADVVATINMRSPAGEVHPIRVTARRGAAHNEDGSVNTASLGNAAESGGLERTGQMWTADAIEINGELIDTRKSKSRPPIVP
jgi:hypothetical protein